PTFFRLLASQQDSIRQSWHLLNSQPDKIDDALNDRFGHFLIVRPVGMVLAKGRKCNKLSKRLTQAASVLLPRQKRRLRESAKYLKSGAPEGIRTPGLCLRRQRSVQLSYGCWLSS